MKELSEAITIGITLVIIGLLWGIFITVEDSDKLEACKKQHNVYQCKMVAVPVEDER